MMQIDEILSQLYGILNCKIALSIDDKLYFYPKQQESSESNSESLEGYRSFEIGEVVSNATFYIDAGAEIEDESISLTVLFIKSQLKKHGNVFDNINSLLNNSYDYSDIAAVSPLLGKDKEQHLIVISGINIADNRAELLEIVKNSLSLKLYSEYQGNLAAVVEDQDIDAACNDLYRNIMTELYEDCIIVVGGKIQSPQQMAELYNLCLEAIDLKKRYCINQNVLNYEGMAVYRLVASMDEGLKQSIKQRIFSTKFVEMLNNEMELTIEEMFKNNLNLTDTSARLFIHRNTLLYRIDKIYKQTGFDLRRFEDSMIFKLAWLMYKEKSI